MDVESHHSAQPNHYDNDAEHYDAINEAGRRLTNQTIADILQQLHAKTILDLTCGTGSQVFWLAKRGFYVVGSDFNNKMLDIARSKATNQQLDIEFHEGDMRTAKYGKFDAVITMFNAVGHLTKHDFETAMQNIRENLNEGGIYIFDIFNLNYLLSDNNITKLTIDVPAIDGDKKVRKIQYSTIDDDGILASYTIMHKHLKNTAPAINTHAQTLQTYTIAQLSTMLRKNGFEILQFRQVDCNNLSELNSENILTIAMKK
jgi:2-polyprenyl-3-methyl-5-hydroxy-6-metoxy-1,4-benzoquinol methylase